MPSGVLSLTSRVLPQVEELIELYNSGKFLMDSNCSSHFRDHQEATGNHFELILGGFLWCSPLNKVQFLTSDDKQGNDENKIKQSKQN